MMIRLELDAPILLLTAILQKKEAISLTDQAKIRTGCTGDTT